MLLILTLILVVPVLCFIYESWVPLFLLWNYTRLIACFIALIISYGFQVAVQSGRKSAYLVLA